MMVALYGLGAAFTWGLGSVLIKAAVGKLPASQLLLLRAFAGAVTAIAAMILFGRASSLQHVPFSVWLSILGATVSGYFAADLLFVRALEAVPLSQALPIQATYPVIAAGLAWAVLGEPPTIFSFGGAIVVIAGIAAIAGADAGGSPVLTPRPLTRRRGFVLLGVSTLGWGVSAVLLRFVLRSLDLIAANALLASLVFVVFLAIARPRAAWSFVRRQPSWVGLLAIAGILGGTGISNLLFVLAVEAGGVMVATALACTASLFTSVMAVAFLREKLSARLAVGVLLTVGGIWMIVGV